MSPYPHKGQAKCYDITYIKAFLFTGGLTDPKKTDCHFEYPGEDKCYHGYFPDLVLVKKSGEFYIIEVKSESDSENEMVKAKKKAVECLQENTT